ARVTAATPNETMTLAVETKEVTGRIDVALRPNGSGTALDVAMVMRPAGLVGSFIFPVVRGAVSDGFGDSVERLAAALTDPRDQTWPGPARPPRSRSMPLTRTCFRRAVSPATNSTRAPKIFSSSLQTSRLARPPSGGADTRIRRASA